MVLITKARLDSTGIKDSAQTKQATDFSACDVKAVSFRKLMIN